MRLLLVLTLFIYALEGSSYEKCWLASPNTDGMTRPFENCIKKIKEDNNNSNSEAEVTPKIRKELALKEGELAQINSSKVGTFYINHQGFMRNAIVYDSGADYFEEGLARTRVKGKIGFFDKNLSIIIKPQYDFAFPFKEGVSRTCMGCKIERIKGSEHSHLVGGIWSDINKKGEFLNFAEAY